MKFSPAIPPYYFKMHFNVILKKPGYFNRYSDWAMDRAKEESAFSYLQG